MLTAMQISAANLLAAQQTSTPPRIGIQAKAATRFVPEGFSPAPDDAPPKPLQQGTAAKPAVLSHGLGARVDVVV
jgi:hypothetical protein